MNADMKWLDNPEVFKVNQLESHSDHCYYLDYSDMKKEKNPLLQSLNGQWEFAYSKNVMERPVDFYKETFDASGFDKIMVPGHIELAGYDKIRYINTMYPWEGKEYHRGAYSMEATGAEEGMFSEAQYNPVGSYIKYFDLDRSMCGKRIHICFEGVEEAMYLWLNGQFIGYAEDSFTPSEFDLTPYIKEKGNVLAVQVHKMSTAAFLEDQDFFRFFGIFRNVTLKALPDVHLEDVWFKPVLNQDNVSGRVSTSMKVSAPDSQHVTACFILKDREENVLVEKSIQLTKENGHMEGTICVDLENVKLWDNHNPYLYHAYVELKAEDGSLAEVIPYDIGFRRIEIIDKVIYLNGKRLVITGVNRHEWNAKTGRCIGVEDMKADISCMLRNNINSVRTCHYPDQIPWYYMCDNAGIYVMAETNLESHGSFQKLGAIEPSCNVPGSFPQWRDAVLDRAKNNFETFKNHTSILFWSLGNESYAGDDIEAMNVYFAEKQDGRLVHYESSYYNRAYEDTISDLETRMYAKPEDVEEYLNNSPKKPYILCEFMHDMGNSMGGLGSYMKLIDKYDRYHGGFIWDFIDQAIMVKDPVTGKDVLRYGGDFDDKPADYEFSANGIVFADRKDRRRGRQGQQPGQGSLRTAQTRPESQLRGQCRRPRHLYGRYRCRGLRRFCGQRGGQDERRPGLGPGPHAQAPVHLRFPARPGRHAGQGRLQKIRHHHRLRRIRRRPPSGPAGPGHRLPRPFQRPRHAERHQDGRYLRTQGHQRPSCRNHPGQRGTHPLLTRHLSHGYFYEAKLLSARPQQLRSRRGPDQR